MPYKYNDAVREDVARRLTGNQTIESISATRDSGAHMYTLSNEKDVCATQCR